MVFDKFNDIVDCFVRILMCRFVVEPSTLPTTDNEDDGQNKRKCPEK